METNIIGIVYDMVKRKQTGMKDTSLSVMLLRQLIVTGGVPIADV